MRLGDFFYVQTLYVLELSRKQVSFSTVVYFMVYKPQNLEFLIISTVLTEAFSCHLSKEMQLVSGRERTQVLTGTNELNKLLAVV